jgi:hypothetical protein
VDAEDETDWTTDPNVTLVANMPALKALLAEAKAHVVQLKAAGVTDRKYLSKLGVEIKRLSGGLVDFAFEVPPPASDTRAVVVRALCPLHAQTLKDGAATLTGAIIRSYGAAFKQHAGAVLVHSNVAIKCWRKGKGGVELKGGAAGCTDVFADKTLLALALVKELHTLGLLAAGVVVCGIIASSNAAAKSLGLDPKKIKHYVAYAGKGVYAGIPIYCTPHPKFASATCTNNQAVAQRVGGALGDRLSPPSRVLDGFAAIGAAVSGRPSVAERIYEHVRKDPTSRATVREWPLRFTSTTTPATEARLQEELRQKSGRGGACQAPRRARVIVERAASGGAVHCA